MDITNSRFEPSTYERNINGVVVVCGDVKGLKILNILPAIFWNFVKLF